MHLEKLQGPARIGKELSQGLILSPHLIQGVYLKMVGLKKMTFEIKTVRNTNNLSYVDYVDMFLLKAKKS